MYGMTKTGAPLTFHTEPCTRCNGEGRIEQYRHIDGGRCAKCHGTKRQLSRTGRAADRAHKDALAERLGRRADQVEVGMVVRDTLGGRLHRVDEIETREDENGTTIWFFTHEPNGRSGSGYLPHRIVRLYDPAVEAEVAAEIAARCPGATLAA